MFILVGLFLFTGPHGHIRLGSACSTPLIIRGICWSFSGLPFSRLGLLVSVPRGRNRLLQPQDKVVLVAVEEVEFENENKIVTMEESEGEKEGGSERSITIKGGDEEM